MENSLKFGAIDIGSNAIRMQITNVLQTTKGPVFKKVEYLRFPMRLGKEVFEEGRISDRMKARFFKLMHSFSLLIDLYEVTDYMGCATSAMREAENGPEILREIKEKYNLEIVLIDGETEAQMINDAIMEHLTEKTYVHIDVGGGSTELNVYKNGVKTESASFKIGSVRRLSKHDAPETWNEMERWVKNNLTRKTDKVTAIGTGGNINKFFELAGKKQGRLMSLLKLKQLQTYVAGLSMEDRIYELQLNPDRADVIIPASDIYISVMRWAGAQSILVPNVGLKDGIMKFLWKKHQLIK